MRVKRQVTPRKRVLKRGGIAKISKPMKKAIKAVISKNIETKTLNVTNPSGLANNNNVPYAALSGVQYLVVDVFKQPQGVNDSTAIGSANRVGDKIKGVGFLMDYYFTMPLGYYFSSNLNYIIPFVKLRITVFRTAFGIPPLSANLLYDSNFNNNDTSTLQPINWDEGYVKEVLYDKVHIIRNNLSVPSVASSTISANYAPANIGNVFHFKKYIKYDKFIKYADNNTTTPNNTDKPICIAISAEVDDAFTGLVPSGSKILFSTGYTRAWFKDA